MADIVESLAGNKMLMLKQDIAFLRKRLAECADEDAKKAIRRELMEKETYFSRPPAGEFLSRKQCRLFLIRSGEIYLWQNFPAFY